MQNLFNGQIGAFAYLLFVLLYMPCVATIGVIYKEIGTFWAGFSVAWSFIVAYSAAVIVYQVSTFNVDPGAASMRLALTILVAGAFFAALIMWGKRSPNVSLIPVKLIE